VQLCDPIAIGTLWNSVTVLILVRISEVGLILKVSKIRKWVLLIFILAISQMIFGLILQSAIPGQIIHMFLLSIIYMIDALVDPWDSKRLLSARHLLCDRKDPKDFILFCLALIFWVHNVPFLSKYFIRIVLSFLLFWDLPVFLCSSLPLRLKLVTICAADCIYGCIGSINVIGRNMVSCQ